VLSPKLLGMVGAVAMPVMFGVSRPEDVSLLLAGYPVESRSACPFMLLTLALGPTPVDSSLDPAPIEGGMNSPPKSCDACWCCCSVWCWDDDDDDDS
jgi:hypothetical protein